MQSGVSCGLFTLVKLHHYQKSLHKQSGFLIILIQVNTKSHLELELWVVLNGFSLGVSPFEMNLSLILLPPRIANHTREAPRAICTKSYRNQTSQDKSENMGQRERNWGCSTETDEEIACRNIALCGSRATLQTRFGFRRQNDYSGVRSSNRPPHWRLNAPLSSIPSLREWLSELIMQKILYRANSRGFKIRLDEARFFTHHTLIASFDLNSNQIPLRSHRASRGRGTHSLMH